MLLIIGFSLTIFFGLLLTLVFVPKMNSVERLGVSYLLGLGILTLLMFFYSLAGYKFTLFNTLVLLSMLILILLFLTRKKIKPFILELKSAFSFRRFSSVEKIIVGVTVFFLLYSLISTLYWPVHSWDALVLYDWRAKLFVDTGGMEEGIARGYFFGYPLLTSLAHTWAYLLGGDNPLFIYTLFLVSFTTIFYWALREFSSRIISLIATLFLVTTPVILGHSTFAYTNLPYAIYFVMGTIHLYIWMVRQKGGYLVLSALMVGLSAWTRISEPFWLTNLTILILYSLWKRKFLSPILYSLFFFSIQQPWKIFENRVLKGTLSTVGQIELSVITIIQQCNFVRAVEVLPYLFKTTVEPWILVVVLLGLAIVKKGRKIFQEKETLFLVFIIINFLLLILGGYVFTFGYSEWRVISESATRMAIFFPPLIIFYLGTSEVIDEVIKDFLNKKSKKITTWRINR